MFANLSDVRCYYELLGTGEPLLLVPGLGCTRNLWDTVATDLAESFCLILPDNRGIGLSVARRAPRTLADYAVDLIELLDHLQLDRVHVMGLSLGGMIAQQLAMDHPSRVERLVLISCSNRFGPYLREIARLLAHAMRRFPTEIFQRTVELLVTAPQYLDAHQDQIEQNLVRARQMGIPRGAIARQLRCLARHDVPQTPEYRITVPTLVLAGEHDVLIPACYARQMADEIPGSEFAVIPSCGHNPFVEQPEAVLPLITEFLSRGRAGAVECFAEMR
jgi:pimeloyl-ACP methyl ester carboxylesterase